MRQQTFILVSPYMGKNSGYEKFKRNWPFAWERINVPEIKHYTPEQIEQIKQNHSKYLKPKKR